MAGLFDEDNLDDTCQRLAEAVQPDRAQEDQRRAIKERLRRLDKELDGYRAVIRSEPEASATVGKWIAETHQERKRLEAMLGATQASTVSAEDIKAMVIAPIGRHRHPR